MKDALPYVAIAFTALSFLFSSGKPWQWVSRAARALTVEDFKGEFVTRAEFEGFQRRMDESFHHLTERVIEPFERSTAATQRLAESVAGHAEAIQGMREDVQELKTEVRLLRGK